jgi:hypothetical protein
MEVKTIYPDINYPHVTDLDLELAELIYPILVEIAPTGDTITYKEVVTAVKERYPNALGVKTLHHRHIGRRLGTIWRFTAKQGCPHIGALVINKDTGECGKGITEFLDPVIEREKVKAFDWSTVEFEFEHHIKKTKAAKKSQETKLKKRNYDDAKNLFFEFWQKIDDEDIAHFNVPVPKKEKAKFREELISTVQEGHAPATALADKLLEFLEKGDMKKEAVEGFVYIGEYQDAETGKSLFDKVKIGYTNKGIEERAVALSGGVVGPLKFVMTNAWRFKPGYAYVAEQRLHGIFDAYRQMGEFFSSMDGLIEEWANETICKLFDGLSEPILIDGQQV